MQELKNQMLGTMQLTPKEPGFLDPSHSRGADSAPPPDSAPP